MDYHAGHSAIVKLNHDRSTLNPGSWKSDHINYAQLDHLNRTSKGNAAYLARPNVAHDTLRQRQFIYPSGWHQKMIANQPILNRGHLIAYSLSKGINYKVRYQSSHLSGDQNNPRNLFTQTAFSNQKLQTIYESKVRRALYRNKKVIFQVQPIFRGHDLMARGVHMQAISTDRSLNFNVYIFNVQPDVKFDYATGRSVIDYSMRIPIPKNAPVFRNDQIAGRIIRYRKYRYHPVSPRRFHRRKLLVNE
ncbi:MAG: hypothetical protein AJITA_00087 [Acetilactobacillus jinshanensis]